MVYRMYDEPSRVWAWLGALLALTLLGTIIIGTLANAPFNIASLETVTPPITQPAPSP